MVGLSEGLQLLDDFLAAASPLRDGEDLCQLAADTVARLTGGQHTTAWIVHRTAVHQECFRGFVALEPDANLGSHALPEMVKRVIGGEGTNHHSDVGREDLALLAGPDFACVDGVTVHPTTGVACWLGLLSCDGSNDLDDDHWLLLRLLASHLGHAYLLIARDSTSNESAGANYQELVEGLPSVTYARSLDRPGAAGFISPQIFDLLGYSPEEFVDNRNLFVERLHPEDRDRLLAAQSRFKPGEVGTTQTVKYRMNHKDGSVVWILNHLRTVRDGDGTPRFVSGVLMDVSEPEERAWVHQERSALLARMVEEERVFTQRLRRESIGRIEAQQYFLEHMARVAGLSEFSQMCAQQDSEHGLLVACAKVARRVSAADYIELVLLDDSGARYRRILLHEKEGVDNSSWGAAETVPWSIGVLEHGTRLVMDSAEEQTPWARHLHERNFRSGLALTVQAGPTTVGVLTVASQFTTHFDKMGQSIIGEFAASIGANLGLIHALAHLESNLDRADAVLVSVLPPAVSARLKRGESQIADRIPVAGVFFCDLAGFTAYSAELEPEEVVSMLQATFSLLEEACVVCQVEKIKTIGDAFMVVSGASIPVDDPIEAIARFAHLASELLDKHLLAVDAGLGFRIGIHAGPVLAGVIGSDRLSFDIWGDTVNFASRLESSGAHGEVRCSNAIRESLGDRWSFRDCGRIAMKGKGERQVWELLDPTESSVELAE